MSDCDDILTRLLFTKTGDAEARRHVEGCARCAREAPAVLLVGATLAHGAEPSPPSALTALVLDGAAPLLARNARRTLWLSVARAVGAALLPLPAILLIDAYVLRGVYAALATVLPETLSFYLVAYYAGLLALLLTLTYGTIPLLAERQVRLRSDVSYG